MTDTNFKEMMLTLGTLYLNHILAPFLYRTDEKT